MSEVKEKLTVENIFSEDGLLADSFPGYQVRDAQAEMARAVRHVIEKNDQLIVEAGTGTGKTFAYLIPALLSGKKIIISTGTKTLQDQLFYRDLPMVVKLLNSSIKKALLKGRANYLCLHRMNLALEEGRFSHKKRIQELMDVKTWSLSTKSGDMAECRRIEERSAILPYVTSTTDNCLGADCEFYDDCYLMKARRRAHKADVIVINHHLYFADQAVKERADKELIPKGDVLIFDEAHQLPEIATQFLGDVFSSRVVNLFVTDFKLAIAKDAPDQTSILDELQHLGQCAANMFDAFGQGNRNAFSNIRHKPKLKNAINELQQQLKLVCDAAKPLAVRSKELESCWQRALKMNENFEKLTAPTPNDQIHWYELTTKHFRLHLTPVSIKEKMREIMSEYEASWIFTSATLATTHNNFSLFADELGMRQPNTLQLDSPFNFKEQTLLYLPPNMPEPKHPDFVRAIIKHALPILKLTRGRAFLLFTSYRAMNEAYELLSQHTNFALLLQGKTAKAELLKRFIETDNCVLLGTSSFWEGVDVRGDALSVVIIDKLPFSVPDEPIIKARVDAMRREGKDPFNDYQLPRAVLSLKQGAGRLIRDVTDRGVLMLCDPRLTSQAYGKVFLDSLPPMPRTDELSEIKEFLEPS